MNVEELGVEKLA